MNHEPYIDDDRDDDERELAALYASLPASTPDARLDATVRAKARVVHRRRWPVALASAATVVLALGLGWRWQTAMPDLAPKPSVAPERAAPQRSAAIVDRLAPEARPAAPAAEAAATAADTSGVVPANPSRALAKRAESPVAYEIAKPSAKMTQRLSAPAPMVAPMPAPVSDSAAAPSPPLPPAPPPPPAPPTDVGAPAPMTMENVETLPPMNSALERVERIRMLERHGQHDAARAEFRALREAFPGFVVPADLGPLGR